MAYVAVKGGERAIRNAHTWLAEERRGDPAVPDLALDQIREQLGRAIDRVMAEGSLYDPDLAALAIKQAQGDLIEAAFLLRAYRTTLPRFAHARPVDTAGDAGRPPHLGDIQGPAGRPDTWARPTTTRIGCWTSNWRRTSRHPMHPAPRPDLSPMPRVPDILGREGLAGSGWSRGCRTRRPDPRAVELSRRPRRAPAGFGARR